MERKLGLSKKRLYADYLEHDSEVSPKYPETAIDLPEPDRLCARCRSINLQEILRTKVRLDRGAFVTDLKSTGEELKASHCVLCQLFGSMCPSDFDEHGTKREEHCHLRAFSANREFAALESRKMVDLNDTTLLGVVRVKVGEANSGRENGSGRIRSCVRETGFLCPWQENPLKSVLNVRPLDPESLSLNFVKDCITYCSQNHSEACKAAADIPMESLRVIDCQTRTIINAPPECQYVALSYVWGRSRASSSSTTLQDAPKVVDDSIDLTLKLNLQYLWVDRYCIDQSKEQKHIQIRQMDLIYSRAHLTVIAAAGQGPDHGLPGTRGTLRSLQPQSRIGDQILISTLSAPKRLIERSKWASRGWTYQEALLSKRRLFITDQQVLYECNGMHCAEALILPLDNLHKKSKSSFREDVPGRSNYNTAPGKKPWEIMAYIQEFNKRDLTFPEDAVNAMLGIFNSFKGGIRPLRQLVGVPILPPVAALRNGKSYKPTHRSAKECFLVGLSWRHLSPSERRQQFPSWTWAGWYGQLAYRFRINEESFCRLDTVSLWIEADDDKLVTFPTWELLDSFLSQLRCQPRFLHIEANSVALSVVYLRRETVLANCKQRTRWIEHRMIREDGYWAEFQIERNWSAYVKLHMDRKILDIDLASATLTARSSHSFVGIALGDTTDDPATTLLVVEDKGSHVERLGISDTLEYIFLEGQSGTFFFGWRRRVVPNLNWTRRKIRLG